MTVANGEPARRGLRAISLPVWILLGASAGIIAGILRRHHWIANVGLAIILWIALDMIYRGSNEVLNRITECGSSCVLDALRHWV